MFFKCISTVSSTVLNVVKFVEDKFCGTFQGVKVIYRTKQLEEQQANRLVVFATVLLGLYAYC